MPKQPFGRTCEGPPPLALSIDPIKMPMDQPHPLS